VSSWTTIVGSGGDFAGAAGSGNFIFKTDSFGFVESTEALDIVYSVQNRLDSISYGPPIMPDLIDQNSNGGYTFSVDSTFILAPNLTAQAKQALKKWVCATEVNFEIDSTSYSNDYNAWDGINSLVFVHPDSMASPLNLAETQVLMNLEWCEENGRTIIHVKDIDIAFNTAADWYTTLPIPTNGTDFQSVILHEFGHAHLLGHALPIGKVMYKGISGNDTIRTLTGFDVDGGIRVMEFSTEPHANCLSDEMLPLSISDCPSSGPNSVSEFNEDNVNETLIYPNPTTGFCKINSSEPIDRILILNGIGQRVIHLYPYGENDLNIDLRNLSTGIYLIAGYHKGLRIFSQKVVKK